MGLGSRITYPFQPHKLLKKLFYKSHIPLPFIKVPGVMVVISLGLLFFKGKQYQQQKALAKHVLGLEVHAIFCSHDWKIKLSA